MAILEIPTRTDLSVYGLTVDLDDVIFSLRFTFNVRSNHWYMDVYDIDGSPLREGVKLVSNWPLLTAWMARGRPEGEFIAANPSSDDDPDRDTIGTSSVLVYDEGGAFGR
jgi:hypothetical protein